jgi:diaminohydroxyphosphoribosylaminopyrimidine deaminase/5-amino-6-(5-phosphoribosylamino)uracil reductase
VAGKGIRRLRDAGIEVTVGVLEAECRLLNRYFITYHTLHRPYVILKWAESADGFLDRIREPGTSPSILSTPLTQLIVHKKRGETDAIMVGTRTALMDNPRLSVRNWAAKSPVRVVIDNELTLPASLFLFDRSLRTLVFNAKESKQEGMTEYIRCDPGPTAVDRMLKALYERNIHSLLVEGGSRLHQSFIDSGLWDEIDIERSSTVLGEGVPAPVIKAGFRRTVKNAVGIPFEIIYKLI